MIILVGSEEQPFGIQKDFLCHRSDFYRKYFAGNQTEDTVEHVVKLADATPEVFGLAQNFLFTGKVMSGDEGVPSYDSLVGLWNLGHKLGVDGLCDKTLEAMTECRRLTERIPSTPLLVQVWRDTPEGSSIRMLLLSWAAEYMRSSDSRAEFAKSLPQEVLSELVVAMSSFELAAPTPAPAPAPAPAPSQSPVVSAPELPRKNVHYLEDQSEDDLNNIRKNRRLSGPPTIIARTDQSLGRKTSRTPLPKPQKRRSSAAYVDSRNFSTSQKLEFCADLLTRMLSGPGQEQEQPCIWHPTNTKVRANVNEQASGHDWSAPSGTPLSQPRTASPTTLTKSSGPWISRPSRPKWTDASTPPRTTLSPTCGKSLKTATRTGKRGTPCG